jgi:hypothetical protein
MTATTKNQARRDAETDPTHKLCTLCLEDLPLSSYTINSGNIFGRPSQCNACKNGSIRQRRATSIKSVESENEEKEMDEVEEEKEQEEKEEEEVQKERQKERKEQQDRHAHPTGATLPPRALSRTITAKNQARRDAEADPTHKFCTLCFADLPLSSYTYSSRGMFELHSRCNTCKNGIRRQRRAESKKGEELEEEEEEEKNEEEEEEEVEEKEEQQEGRQPHNLYHHPTGALARTVTAKNQARRDVEADPMHKSCTLCLEDLPLTSYTTNLSGIFGRQSRCNTCMNSTRSLHNADQARDEGDMDVAEEDKEEE